MANNKASDIVEKALNEVLHLIEDYEEGDVLVDWVVVAFVANPDAEKNSGYPMIFPNGEMPLYRARGLLGTALVKLDATQGS